MAAAAVKLAAGRMAVAARAAVWVAAALARVTVVVRAVAATEVAETAAAMVVVAWAAAWVEAAWAAAWVEVASVEAAAEAVPQAAAAGARAVAVVWVAVAMAMAASEAALSVAGAATATAAARAVADMAAGWPVGERAVCRIDQSVCHPQNPDRCPSDESTRRGHGRPMVRSAIGRSRSIGWLYKPTKSDLAGTMRHCEISWGTHTGFGGMKRRARRAYIRQLVEAHH